MSNVQIILLVYFNAFAAISFGIWQGSFWAGLFMFFVLVIVWAAAQ